MLIVPEGSETVVSQEMVRHDNVDEMSPGDDAAAAVEIEKQDDAEESGDGWLTGWKLPVLSDVVNKTSSVVQQTVQQTSSVVCSHFTSITLPPQLSTFLFCFVLLAFY